MCCRAVVEFDVELLSSCCRAAEGGGVCVWGGGRGRGRGGATEGPPRAAEGPPSERHRCCRVVVEFVVELVVGLDVGFADGFVAGSGLSSGLIWDYKRAALPAYECSALSAIIIFLKNKNIPER